MQNYISWFEIPTKDLDRAINFYNVLFDFKLEKQDFAGIFMAMFPMDGKNISGALVHGEGYEPSDKGVLIYLNGGDDLNKVLDKVESAGGKVIKEKSLISEEMGYWGAFLDTEGNKIGLFSQK